MSFFMNSETFYDPARLADAPLVQDFAPEMPSTIDYNAFFGYDTFVQGEVAQDQFCIDKFQTLCEPGTSGQPPSGDFYPPANHYSAAFCASMTQVNPTCVQPSVFSDQLDAWLASQVDEQRSPGPSANAGSRPRPAGVDTILVMRRPMHTLGQFMPVSKRMSSWLTHVRFPYRTARPPKRRVDDSDYEDGAGPSSDCSEYAPRRPAKRPTTTKKAVHRRLPESLQPIRIQPATLPRCPLPGCGLVLEAKDSAWRGHFKRAHHELCLTDGCTGLSVSCKAKCPLPIPDCKSCGSDDKHKHKHSHAAQRGAGGAMTIESVGRHLLNVHFKVAYRCPLCGLQTEWRESACVRHIQRCAEKHPNQRKGSMSS
ncbi:hypothetical protein C8T65DRAFT_736386 [Cerioporus squamosus]|nr:hypothetical protein C8T65DRAFT_736386 [Cerioporus squamosus]